jgi:hypothetical protein
LKTLLGESSDEKNQHMEVDTTGVKCLVGEQNAKKEKQETTFVGITDLAT